jgi:hypothetical protein
MCLFIASRTRHPNCERCPQALERALPTTTVVELVDFEHLMGYLDDR